MFAISSALLFARIFILTTHYARGVQDYLNQKADKADPIEVGRQLMRQQATDRAMSHKLLCKPAENPLAKPVVAICTNHE